MENDSAARKGGRHAKTVSERGRQPRSLTDYKAIFAHTRDGQVVEINITQ